MKNTAIKVAVPLLLAVFFVPVFAFASTPPPWFYTDAFHGVGGGANTPIVPSGTSVTLAHSFSIGKIHYFSTTNVFNDTANASSTNSGYSPSTVNVQTEVTASGLGDGQWVVFETGGDGYCFFTVLLGTVDMSNCGGVAPSIPFGSIVFPSVYSTSSAAIAASSSLWGAFASTSQLQTQCTSGNVFSDGLCLAGTFLFVPNPNVVQGFVDLDTAVLPTRFPFSWYFGIKSTYTALSASSTSNMATVFIDFSTFNAVASSSPFGTMLPNHFTLLSSTTISTYLSPTTLNILLALETAAIWILFSVYVFRDVQHGWLHK